MFVCRGVNHEAGLGLRWKHFRKNFVKRFSRQSEFSNLYRYHLLEWGKGEINILRKYKTNFFISTPGRLGQVNYNLTKFNFLPKEGAMQENDLPRETKKKKTKKPQKEEEKLLKLRINRIDRKTERNDRRRKKP